MTTSRNPIAVFDSGLGGLTVVRQLMRRLPAESIVYFGDTARVPYGIKSAETVTRFARENIEFLQTFGPKLIIAACNTASSAALPRLNGEYTVRLCGVVEPGARAAANKTRTGLVGVIGTEATIGSGCYTRCIADLNRDIKVTAKACPLLVPLVEDGRTSHDALVRMALEEYLRPLREAGVDTLVLGCTHYPLLKPGIREVMGPSVQIVDSARQTAQEAEKYLAASGELSRRDAEGRHRFFASDHPERFARLGKRFLGRPMGSVRLVQPELLDGRLALRVFEEN
ncbi:MAG: glutamate racemase [Planctomycetes bacterium]|nr:glutamate racemase [Planctomycetota bacterium]